MRSKLLILVSVIFFALFISCKTNYEKSRLELIKKNYCTFSWKGGACWGEAKLIHKNLIPEECKSCMTNGLIINEIKSTYENKYNQIVACPLFKDDSIKIYTYYLIKKDTKTKLGFYIKSIDNEFVEDSIQANVFIELV